MKRSRLITRVRKREIKIALIIGMYTLTFPFSIDMSPGNLPRGKTFSKKIKRTPAPIRIIPNSMSSFPTFIGLVNNAKVKRGQVKILRC